MSLGLAHEGVADPDQKKRWGAERTNHPTILPLRPPAHPRAQKFGGFALRELPGGEEAQNKFTFAVAAIIGKVRGMKVEGLAALLMCCASRAAGVRDPRPTEAAAMGVAAGLDAPTRSRDQRERLEDNWVRRLALVEARVAQAMRRGEEIIAQYVSGD